MKKFILVMVFVLLTALFIAFNYLLWDRESKVAQLKSLENEKASYYASINAQKRETQALEEEVGALQDQLEQMEAEKKSLIEEKNELNNDWIKTKETLQERIEFINVLKQHADINVLSEPVVKWAQAVNEGDFKEAYYLEYEGVAVQDRAVSLISYVEQLEGTVSRIDIAEVKIDVLRGAGTGDIYLYVKLNVKLAEEPKQQSPRFTQGENEVFVRIDYSYNKKAFVISSINSI